METTRYKRKPFYVDEVRVTEENMTAIAKWCGGRIRTSNNPKDTNRYIKVEVHNALTNRQTTAFVGDHVLWSETGGFKVYTHDAFLKAFERAAEQTGRKVKIHVDN